MAALQALLVLFSIGSIVSPPPGRCPCPEEGMKAGNGRYTHCYVPRYYPGGGKLVQCGNTTVAPNVTVAPNGTACPPEKPGGEAVCDPAINTEDCPYDQGTTPQGKNCDERIYSCLESGVWSYYYSDGCIGQCPAEEPTGGSPCSANTMSSAGTPPEECVYKKGKCDEQRISCDNGKWNATGTDNCYTCPKELPEVNSVCSERNNEDCPYHQGATDQGKDCNEIIASCFDGKWTNMYTDKCIGNGMGEQQEERNNQQQNQEQKGQGHQHQGEEDGDAQQQIQSQGDKGDQEKEGQGKPEDEGKGQENPGSEGESGDYGQIPPLESGSEDFSKSAPLEPEVAVEKIRKVIDLVSPSN